MLGEFLFMGAAGVAPGLGKGGARRGGRQEGKSLGGTRDRLKARLKKNHPKSEMISGVGSVLRVSKLSLPVAPQLPGEAARGVGEVARLPRVLEAQRQAVAVVEGHRHLGWKKEFQTKDRKP